MVSIHHQPSGARRHAAHAIVARAEELRCGGGT